MTTRPPAPVFRIPAIDDEELDRPKLDFPLPRVVAPESAEGDLPYYEQSRRQIFQVKLDGEISIGEFVEIARAQAEFEMLITSRFSQNLTEWAIQMRNCCVRMIKIWMYDYVPDAVIENLSLTSMQEAVDFLFGLMPKDAQEMAQLERKRLQALAASTGIQ